MSAFASAETSGKSPSVAVPVSRQGRRNPAPAAARSGINDTDAAADGAQGSSGGQTTADGLVVIPGEEQLMQSHRLQQLADQLSQSLIILQTQLSVMQQRLTRDAADSAAPSLPFQIRRAEAAKLQLEKEVHQTARTIRQLHVMSEQVAQVMSVKNAVREQTKKELEKEIATLQAERDESLQSVRDGYIERINLLNRYWPWKQLLDLGDTRVGATFAEELRRGPRYRHVGLQNNIQSDYTEQQLRWLEAFAAREDTFRQHLRRLDGLVEDLGDVNDLLESTLTCSVCGLIFEEPVLFWPCGHTFCLECFQSLTIAPSLFRCSVCGSIGSEGYLHNLLVAETVAKWMFKDSGYGDLQGPLNSIRVHLARFRKEEIQSRLAELRERLREQKAEETSKDANAKTITFAYRAY